MNQCGTMIAIGGALQPNGAALRAFYEYSGGSDARIVIIPTASMLRNGGYQYLEIFARLGLKQPAVLLPIRKREETNQPEYVRAIEAASGVFMGGGTQTRLSTILGGTPIHHAMIEAYRRGTVIGGTSAGTAALSGVMITSGRGGSLPKGGLATFAPGLGFTSRIIFDQHFRQRNRLGRLLYAVATHPGMVGIGIDEDTAAIVEGDLLTVAGTGSVSIVDGTASDGVDPCQIEPGRPVPFSGIRLHSLVSGGTFSLASQGAFAAENLAL